MGTYLFRWTEPADTVSVTGNFANCNWSNSIRLEKATGGFEKQIQLESSDEQVVYKYIVDGVWKVDPSKPTELDASGNKNNVLDPKDIETTSSTAAATTSSGPAAVDQANAASSSKEMDSTDDKMPGSFPEATPLDEARDPNEQAFGVNPIPASSGYGNPVKLEPGQPVPPTNELTSSSVQSNVTTDRESYEKAGSAPFSSLGGVGAGVGAGILGAGAAVAGAVGLNSALNPSRFDHDDPTGPDTTHGKSSGLAASGYTQEELDQSSKDAFHQDPTGPNSTHGALAAGGVAGAVSGAAAAASTTVQNGASSLKGFDHDDPVGADAIHGTSFGDRSKGYTTSELEESSQEAFHQDPTGPNTTHGALAAGGVLGAVGGAAAAAASTVKNGASSLTGFDHDDPVGANATHGTTLGDRSSGYKASELDPSSHEAFHNDPTGPDATHGTSSSGFRYGAGSVAGAVGGGIAGLAAAVGLSGKSGKSEKSENLIPESSLPMGDGTKEVEKDEGPVMRSAAGTDTSTSALAGQVPLEPRGVPRVVQDSQAEAGAPPEASQSSEAVQEKSQVEQELKDKVPEEEPTSGNKGIIAGAVGGVAAATAGGLAFASQKAGVPQSIQDKISSMNTSTSQPADDVPRPVAESYERSDKDPEAAANPEAVHEKADVERELLKDVKPTDATGEPAPVTTAETSAVAPGASPLASDPSNASADAASKATPVTTAETSAVAPGASPLASDPSNASADAAGKATPVTTAETPAVAPGASSLASDPPTTSGTSEPISSKALPTETSESGNAGLIAGGVGAGVGAAALGAGGYALSRGSDTQGVSSSIRDPTSIPSTDPNVTIADADTMPAIAIANRDVPSDPSAPLASSNFDPASSSVTGTIKDGSVPANAYGSYNSLSTVPYSSSGELPTSTTSALADRSVGTAPQSSATTSSAIPTTSATSGPGLDVPEDATAATSNSPAAAIAARVFGAPTSGTTGTTAPSTVTESAIARDLPTTTAPPSSSLTSGEPTTLTSTAATAQPTSAVNSTIPAGTTSASALSSTGNATDPSTKVSTIANDSVATTNDTTGAPAPSVPGGPTSVTDSSATKDSAIGGAGVTSGSGLNASANDPAKSVATEAGASTATKENERKFGQAPAMTKKIPSAREEAEASMGSSVFGKESQGKQADRDVSPFSREATGPSTTTGTSTTATPAKTGPSTPQKASKTATTGTPASASSAGTPGTGKSEKRRSRLSQWFSEHVGSERKSKK